MVTRATLALALLSFISAIAHSQQFVVANKSDNKSAEIYVFSTLSGKKLTQVEVAPNTSQLVKFELQDGDAAIVGLRFHVSPVMVIDYVSRNHSHSFFVRPEESAFEFQERTIWTYANKMWDGAAPKVETRVRIRPKTNGVVELPIKYPLTDPIPPEPKFGTPDEPE